MRSALGSVSGSKAPLTTVHAKLEATVLRARRHQGSGSSTADARACAASLRNAAAVLALGRCEDEGAPVGEAAGRQPAARRIRLEAVGMGAGGGLGEMAEGS